MTINFEKIASVIADELLPIQNELAEEKKKLEIAIKILRENGLADEYFRRRRKQIISAILIPEQPNKSLLRTAQAPQSTQD